MTGCRWSDVVEGLASLLRALAVTDGRGRPMTADAGFDRWVALTGTLRKNGRTVFLIGNGASASMASHFAADLAKNAALNTQVFFDSALITAISNDMGYEYVFAEPLKRRGRRGDMLVAVSSSGRSPNILAGVEQAVELGLNVVTLSAMQVSNPLRKAGQLNFHVAASEYGAAESCHAAILHHWMDRVECGVRAGRK
jgi:D-sedoheptulose 7-phosphate isomerase